MIIYKYIIFIMNILLLRANIFNHECKAKGYVLGAIAAATYGMNPLFALPLYKAGIIRIQSCFQIFIRDPGIGYHDQSERAEL